MDNYTEQIVKAKPKIIHYILFMFMILLSIISLYLVLFTNLYIGLSLLMFIICLFGIYFAKIQMKYEYEYLFTNGDLEISKIVNKSTRRSLIEVSDSDIQSIKKFHSDAEKGLKESFKIYDFTSGEEAGKDNWYKLFINSEKKTFVICLELNEKTKQYIEKVYKKKLVK